MEDFKIEIVTGVGAGAAAITIPIQRFPWWGPPRRTGQLTSPLLSRFGIVERLDFYAPAELTTIVKRSASILGIRLDEDGALKSAVARAHALALSTSCSNRVRDFAEVRGDGRSPARLPTTDCADWAWTSWVWTRGDRRLLRAIMERFDGGPAGIESLAAALAEDRDTWNTCTSPISSSRASWCAPRAAVQATRQAYEHMKIPPPSTGRNSGQGSLF